jgi:cell division protein ZapE
LPQTGSALARYERLVGSRTIERDEAQLSLIRKLDTLAERLSEHRLARKSNVLGWLFARKGKPVTPRGLYIWGGVGRGKTMLMDLFYEAAPVRRKRRVHFHAFMADVHERIHDWRQQHKVGLVKGDDVMTPIAEALAEEAWLLCFDEFVVTDITDAMILSRLFSALFAEGVVVVATSNVIPDRLYEGGLNRALFTPFIEQVKTHMEIVELKSRTDFRLEKLAGAPVYYTPNTEQARLSLDAAFFKLSSHHQGAPVSLDVAGHKLVLPQLASGVVRASFEDLCAKAYAANDYLHLARAFHTLILDDIPMMNETKRNEAKRFIWLIDALYDHGVKLVASAEAEPALLYQATDGYEAFAFDRTVSRLMEMQSNSYLSRPHGAADSAATGNIAGLVET